jgi:hypothetical protein
MMVNNNQNEQVLELEVVTYNSAHTNGKSLTNEGTMVNNELKYELLTTNQPKGQHFVCHKTKCKWTSIILLLVLTIITCSILVGSGYTRHNKQESMVRNEGRAFISIRVRQLLYILVKSFKERDNDRSADEDLNHYSARRSYRPSNQLYKNNMGRGAYYVSISL